MARKLRVAIVGLGFGAEFIPIYQRHPEAELAGICQRNPASLKTVGDQFKIPEARRFARYEDVLAAKDIDAVHINTPIGEHARMSLQALEAGKHCACTVPACTTVDEAIALCRARKRAGKVYMMMETAVYTREFLHVQTLVDQGRFGRLQFLRGSHQQDMSVGWPEYWWGFPPMHYATHAVSPLFSLAKAVPERVVCYGSGRIRAEYIARYQSPFAVETALFKLRNSDIACEATRSLYETVRQYRESFDVYGEKLAFEWEQLANEKHVLHTGGENAQRMETPDSGHLLPKEIAPFTTGGVYDEANQHLSFFQGAGHGGSHPHLTHEFVRAALDNRPSAVDAPVAAAWTAAGICAHQSALADGTPIEIPDFTKV